MDEIHILPISHLDSVEVAFELPFEVDTVVAAIGGPFADFWQGRRPEVHRSFAWEHIVAVALLLLGVRGWNQGRDVLSLPGGRCRITDYASIVPWLPGINPIYRAILRLVLHLRQARLRRHLLTRLSV